MYKYLLKPLLDFIFTGLAFILLLPVFVLISFLIFFTSGTNPFFLQKRPGKNEKIFTIIKFRTMNNNRDNNGELLPDSNRLTRIGRLLRKTYLDEIPQLINVFKNDMSLIGPRPLLPEYLKLYNDFQKKRHLVKPGITGLAQISVKDNICWQEKFKFDIYYVDNVSFILDCKIFFQTIKKVFFRIDKNSSNVGAMNRFKGNN